MAVSHHTSEDLIKIYQTVSTITVLGASASEHKAAHAIPRYLAAVGYTIVPVNPRGGELFGFPVLTSLDEVGGEHSPIELLNVWRPAAESVAIAEKAVELGVKRLWYQLELDTPEATEIARAAGIDVITGVCIGERHGALGLGPGPRRPQ